MSKILFVDDKWQINRWDRHFQREWRDLDFEVAFEERADCALERLANDGPFHLVLLDLKFDDQSVQGIDVLPLIKKEYPELPIIILSSREDAISQAVDCTKLGASSYFAKHQLDFQKLALEIQNYIQLAEQRHKTLSLTEELNTYRKYDQLIYKSAPMAKLVAKLSALADTPSTVLITGESGTGKELVSTALHRMSQRSREPFIKVNCSAVPVELAESELFGHKKGAFTSASGTRRGKFELANGGTIFLDEVADLIPEVQAKLLRVIQEKVISPVGSERDLTVDVRIVAATNKDLAEQVRMGLFREDLYYRLNVIPVDVPPLKTRKEDLPILVEHFRKKLNEELAQNIKEIDPECINMLSNYDWPGNVRELENVMEQAFIQARLESEDSLTQQHFPPLGTDGKGTLDVDTSILVQKYAGDLYAGKLSWEDISEELDTIRKQIILTVLDRERGNGRAAAGVLGISRGNLAQWLHKWKISTLEFRP
jgi:two-component system, NtrC family, response regulator AtoC